MIKIAICEDEKIMAEDIKNNIDYSLSNIRNDYSVSIFNSGEELTSCENKFNIYFIDIRLKKLSGIDAASYIKSAFPDALIIFVTSFKDYIFDAFDVHAFNYILKPIDVNRFSYILNSAVRFLYKNDEFIIAKFGQSSNKIFLNDILFIEAIKRKIAVHTVNDVIEYYSKLSDLEEFLKNKDFFRCHKSFIVNLMYIKSYDSTSITLKNSQTVFLSKHKVSEFSKTFMYYLKKGGC